MDRVKYYSKIDIKKLKHCDPLELSELLKMPPTVAQALKYIWRRGDKPNNSETEDLKKAINCLRRRLEMIEPCILGNTRD